MNISNIVIENFRGIEKRKFQLDSRMNVIVGNNTAGKTSVLHAIQVALGGYLQSLSFLPKEKPYRRNFIATDRPTIDIKGESIISNNRNPRVEVEAVFDMVAFDEGESHKKINFSWYRESKGNTTIHSAKNVGELVAVVNEMLHYRENKMESKNVIMPIVLAFGADRIDNNYKVVKKTKYKESRWAKAYKFALSEYVGFRNAFDWIDRFGSSTKISKEFEGTDIAFLEALGVAAKLENIEMDSKNHQLWADVKVTNLPSKRLPYELMSDGFKAMINLASEIAYRCIMLNGFLGKDAVRRTPGIVLIDEIDIYLHPHWQQHVLADLRAAFPEIQFIVTTHSPYIVQSVEGKSVITLDGKVGTISPTNRGIEEIAVSEMGMEGMMRSAVYREKMDLATRYYELVKAGEEDKLKIEDVKRELDELELKAGLLHDPAYEAFLKFNRK